MLIENICVATDGSAAENGCDLVVVGTHGINESHLRLTGSVSG